MGYTHYWERVPHLPAPEFRLFSAVCKRMAEEMEGNIGGPEEGFEENPGPPKFTRETVAFNGVGDQAHEPFIVERIYKPPEWNKDETPRPAEGLGGALGYFDCTKTAREPYDVVVVGALHAATILFGYSKFGWDSDGDQDEHRDGRELAERVMREMGLEERIQAHEMLNNVARGARV